MTTEHKVARRKLSMLELACELGNVSKACRLMGYSRQQFYEIPKLPDLWGRGPSGSFAWGPEPASQPGFGGGRTGGSRLFP